MALGILALFAGRAQAFEKAGSLDGVDYRFICADWALLKEKINALVILSRPPGAPATRACRGRRPAGAWAAPRRARARKTIG